MPEQYDIGLHSKIRSLDETARLYIKLLFDSEIPHSEELKNSLALSIKDQCKAICDLVDNF